MNNQKTLTFSKRIAYKIILYISFALALLCLTYLVRGFYFLIIDRHIGAADLYSRWKEQQYIYHGLYPYDINQDSPFVDPKLGPVISGGYPPWAFFSGFIFFPNISFELTRWYHALLNTVSLIVLSVFAYQIGRPYGNLKAWFTVIVCLSLGSHSTTLGTGQYGCIINALLIGMYWLLKKNYNLSAGLIFGLALLKPTISAPFFMIFLIKKRISASFICLFYLVISSSIIGILIHTSPIYMIEKMISVSRYYVHTGYSAINFLMAIGMKPIQATTLLVILASITIIFLSYFFKNYSLLFLFALASVIGRICAYHLAYDNTMLVFLLLAFIDLTFKKPTKYNILFFSLLYLTLLIPSSTTNLLAVSISQSTIWIASFAFLLSNQKNFKELAST